MDRWPDNRAWFLLLPALCLLALVGGLPLLAVVNYGLHDIFTLDQLHWVGLQWFEDILHSDRFWASLGRSLLFSALALGVQIPLGILVAKLLLSLGRRAVWGLVLCALPLVVPWNMIPMLWLGMIQPQTGLFGFVAAWGFDGFVAQIPLRSECPFPWTDLSCALRNGCSECGEAVEDGGPDLKFGDLAVEIAGHDTLAQKLEAAHLGLDQASAVVAGPALPDGPAKTAATAERLVAHHRPCGWFLPPLAVLAGWNDRGGPARRDGGVTGAGVVGTIGCDHADGLAARDLVQQVGQHGGISNPAAGDLDGPDFQRFCINPKVNLAPIAWFGWPVLLCQPLAIAFGFHACAVDQEVQGTGAGAVGNMDCQGLLAAAKGAVVRHRPIQPGKPQKARHHTCRLPQWQPEERLQRQAYLDCGVGEHGLTPAPAGRRGQPLCLGIEPDRQRSAPSQRLVVVMPVRGAVDGGLRFAHAYQLPRWIHRVNPPSHLRNKAPL